MLYVIPRFSNLFLSNFSKFEKLEITIGKLSPPISNNSLDSLFSYLKGEKLIFLGCLINVWLARLLYLFTNSLATGDSNSGSSVKDTLIVSPIPSSRSVPIPIADLILPSSPSPASVTPKWRG